MDKMVKPTKPSDIKVGMRVYWTDLDHDICSNWGRVVTIQHDPFPSDDSIISLAMDDGAEVECLWHELSIDILAEILDERSAERSKRWSQ